MLQERSRLESGGSNITKDHNMETIQKTNKQMRQRWIDRVREDLNLLEIIDGEQLAKNRKSRRSVVEAARHKARNKRKKKIIICFV